MMTISRQFFIGCSFLWLLYLLGIGSSQADDDVNNILNALQNDTCVYFICDLLLRFYIVCFFFITTVLLHMTYGMLLDSNDLK